MTGIKKLNAKRQRRWIKGANMSDLIIALRAKLDELLQSPFERHWGAGSALRDLLEWLDSRPDGWTDLRDRPEDLPEDLPGECLCLKVIN